MSTDKLGRVFHDPNFRFRDGSVGNKLFVILSCSPIFVVIARTTSNSSGRSRSYGCNNDDRYPSFYLPSESKIFNEDTWICLDYFMEISTNELNSKIQNKQLREISTFTPIAFKDLINCALQSLDITNAQETELQKTLALLEHTS